MPTVDIFPTLAAFTEGWTGYNGSSNVEADVGFINDSNDSTYVTSPEESDVEFHSIAISAFNNNSVYSGKVINRITLTTTGKTLDGSPLLSQTLTTVHRGTNVFISANNTFVSGLFNATTTYTTFNETPLSAISFKDNHIDELSLNISVSNGRLLILDVFIRVDYVQVTAGRIEMNSGFVELMEGHLALQ